MCGIIEMPCSECGGDGGFSFPQSMDPFTGHITEGVEECRACGGRGIEEIETYLIELHDLDQMQTWVPA